MREDFCQSCGMPLAEDTLLGTNADGTKNGEYCKYCMKDGKFVDDISMEEMIEKCIPMMLDENTGMTEHSARTMMSTFLPGLKRWKRS